MRKALPLLERERWFLSTEVVFWAVPTGNSVTRRSKKPSAVDPHLITRSYRVILYSRQGPNRLPSVYTELVVVRRWFGWGETR